jgi:hypothetical protein
MVDNSTVDYFESHLTAGLGLPPSMFLVSIMNFLRCELVHLNLNAIIALSCLTVLCECWLGITPDTNLLWYFYYPAWYDKTIFSGIRLSPLLRHPVSLIHMIKLITCLGGNISCWSSKSGI